MVAVRHLGFLKVRNFNCSYDLEGQCASSCQMLCRSVKPLWRYRDFWIFQDVGSRHVVFLNFKFVTVRMVKRVELRHRAKFCWNRWNRGWDMAIFRFFKMAAAAILHFWNYKFITVRRVMSVELRHHAKFSGDRSNRCWDISILYFSRWRPSAILDL